MKQFLTNLAQAVAVAAILGGFAFVLKVNERLARIESRLGIVADARR